MAEIDDGVLYGAFKAGLVRQAVLADERGHGRIGDDRRGFSWSPLMVVRYIKA